MALIATLVVGSNNATSSGGPSTPLSTPADRARFLQLHRSASAIITGRKSAQVEDYAKTSVPIFVLTHKNEKLSLTHSMMEQITVNENLSEVARGIESRFEGDVIIESGVELLQDLIEVGAVDELALTISPIEGDGDFIDLVKLLANFSIEKEVEIEGTRLLECRYHSNSANS